VKLFDVDLFVDKIENGYRICVDNLELSRFLMYSRKENAIALIFFGGEVSASTFRGCHQIYIPNEL